MCGAENVTDRSSEEDQTGQDIICTPTVARDSEKTRKGESLGVSLTAVVDQSQEKAHCEQDLK